MRPVPVIYVASACRPCTSHSQGFHLDFARGCIDYVRSFGYAAIAPHVMLTPWLDDADPDQREMGMAMGRAVLERCDELWEFNPGCPTPSEGVTVEIQIAKARGIHVTMRDLPTEYQPPRESIRQVVASVAARLGVSTDEIFSPSRLRAVVRARQVAMLLAWEQGSSYAALGRYFRRDHTTVMHSVRMAVTLPETKWCREAMGG